MVESSPESFREMRLFIHRALPGAISEQEYLKGLRNVGFVNVKVTDRIFYDDQVMGLINENELQINWKH